MSKRKYGIKMSRNPKPYKRPTFGRKKTRDDGKTAKGKTSAPVKAPRKTFTRAISDWLSPWTGRLSPLAKRAVLVLISGLLFGGLVSFFSGMSVQQSLLRAVVFGVVVVLLYLLMELSITTVEKKGYSWWLGLLFFLVPPLIGLVIVFLLPRKAKAQV